MKSRRHVKISNFQGILIETVAIENPTKKV